MGTPFRLLYTLYSDASTPFFGAGICCVHTHIHAETGAVGCEQVVHSLIMVHYILPFFSFFLQLTSICVYVNDFCTWFGTCLVLCGVDARVSMRSDGGSRLCASDPIQLSVRGKTLAVVMVVVSAIKEAFACSIAANMVHAVLLLLLFFLFKVIVVQFSCVLNMISREEFGEGKELKRSASPAFYTVR